MIGTILGGGLLTINIAVEARITYKQQLFLEIQRHLQVFSSGLSREYRGRGPGPEREREKKTALSKVDESSSQRAVLPLRPYSADTHCNRHVPVIYTPDYHTLT